MTKSFVASRGARLSDELESLRKLADKRRRHSFDLFRRRLADAQWSPLEEPKDEPFPRTIAAE